MNGSGSINYASTRTKIGGEGPPGQGDGMYLIQRGRNAHLAGGGRRARRLQAAFGLADHVCDASKEQGSLSSMPTVHKPHLLARLIGTYRGDLVLQRFNDLLSNKASARFRLLNESTAPREIESFSTGMRSSPRYIDLKMSS